jgi:hypothetical protein
VFCDGICVHISDVRPLKVNKLPIILHCMVALLMSLNKPIRKNVNIIYHSGAAEGCGLAVSSSSKIVSELLHVLCSHHS